MKHKWWCGDAVKFVEQYKGHEVRFYDDPSKLNGGYVGVVIGHYCDQIFDYVEILTDGKKIRRLPDEIEPISEPLPLPG